MCAGGPSPSTRGTRPTGDGWWLQGYNKRAFEVETAVPVVDARLTPVGTPTPFYVDQLGSHADPLSLYIVTRPTDKARLRPLIRILLNMIVRLLADRVALGHGRDRARHAAEAGAELVVWPQASIYADPRRVEDKVGAEVGLRG